MAENRWFVTDRETLKVLFDLDEIRPGDEILHETRGPMTIVDRYPRAVWCDDFMRATENHFQAKQHNNGQVVGVITSYFQAWRRPQHS